MEKDTAVVVGVHPTRLHMDLKGVNSKAKVTRAAAMVVVSSLMPEMTTPLPAAPTTTILLSSGHLPRNHPLNLTISTTSECCDVCTLLGA